jgi:hypothetical protein
MAFQSRPKRAALALLAAVVAVVVVSGVFVVGADNDPPPKKRKKVRAKFVNQLPDAPIEVFWEDHSDKTRRFEANLRPRGGWHVSNSFAGHGEKIGMIIFPRLTLSPALFFFRATK